MTDSLSRVGYTLPLPVRRSGCWTLDSSSCSWRVCNRTARTTCSEVTLKCLAISGTCHPQFSMVAQLSSNVSSKSMPFPISGSG
jgi:hypothetical protein